MRYWLFKKEPKNISIDDFVREGTVAWHGVRNYQARNFMRDDMQPGDKVLIYHSNSEPSAVMGVGEIVSMAYPDHTAMDPAAYHYDAKATPENPIWLMLDVRLLHTLARPVSLREIRETPALQDMLLIKRGMRLSLQPVSEADFQEVVRLGSRA